MTIEQLRREVVRAIDESHFVQPNNVAIDDHVRDAFDAYDKARDAANKPTFEGDEAEALRWLTGVRSVHACVIRDLLDAEDAEKASNVRYSMELASRLDAARSERDAALSRAEQAEAALAEERKAMSEAASYAIEDLREWLVNYPDAYDRDTTEQAITTLSRFILPAKPAVDPLRELAVEMVLADGVIRTGNQEQAIRDGRAAQEAVAEHERRLRAAIERAGGVKAVFGEGV